MDRLFYLKNYARLPSLVRTTAVKSDSVSCGRHQSEFEIIKNCPTMSSYNYVIRKAQSNEQPVLLTFIMDHFIPRSGVTVWYENNNRHRIDEAEEKIIAEDRKNVYSNMLCNAVCYVSVHNDTNSIVGMILLDKIKNPEFEKNTVITENGKSVVMQSKVFCDYKKYVLDPLFQSANVFTKFPTIKTALKLSKLCVHPEHSGQGIGTRLIFEAIEYAKTKDIELVYGLFTSPSSQKAAERNDFQSFNNVDLMSLRDGDGNEIFKDAGSHIVCAMAKCLKSIF